MACKACSGRGTDKNVKKMAIKMAKPKLLVVDDTQANLISTCESLEDLDIEIITCISGYDAVKASLKHSFFLMLIDVQMPELNGFETVDLIKKEKRNRNVPIIFLTGISKDREHTFQGYKNGAVDYIYKPIHDPQILIWKVEVFLNLYKHQKALSEKNDELENFARVISHDLKSPVAQIMSIMDLMKGRESVSGNTELKEMIEMAVSVGSGMLKLIDGLLDYSTRNGKRDNFKQLSLDFVLDMVFNNLEVQIRESEAEIIKTNIPEKILGDETLLVQLFQNLISNSIKYRSETRTPKIEIIYEKNEVHQYLYIKDNGLGIPKDAIDSIFSLFSRAHREMEHEGHGIGLATCKKIIDIHGWQIHAESEVGKGTTFIITL